MDHQPLLTLNEFNTSSGKIIKSYVLSESTTGVSQPSTRLDQVPLQHITAPYSSTLSQQTHQSSTIHALPTTYYHALLSYLATLFLPTGYPTTVTLDYTSYQIYDSIQAFASSIASLLSSRAVLQSLDVVSMPISPDSASDVDGLPASSASAATAATLLSVAQNTLANLTTILFASHAASRISPDVKFYRFLADVVNDAAFVLDMLAPSLPNQYSQLPLYLPSVNFPGPFNVLIITLSPLINAIGHLFEILHFHVVLGLFATFLPSPRVLALCSSSMLRAMCGVAGGSSKAVLSTHFARNNPEAVGDLNAKDGSQETVVNLLGMWIGGLVISRVEGLAATWCWMVVLLGVHLWANYMAVRSLRLSGLNRRRAGLLFASLVRYSSSQEQIKWEDLSVENVNRQESILGLREILSSWRKRQYAHDKATDWRSVRMGVSVEDLVGALSSEQHRSEETPGSLALGHTTKRLQELISLFRVEAYLLWIDSGSGQVWIALKQGAQADDQLKARYHASVAQMQRSGFLTIGAQRKTMELVSHSLELVNEHWKTVREKLEDAGWDLVATNLEDGSSMRIDIAPPR